jgi:hypothetical protein
MREQSESSRARVSHSGAEDRAAGARAYSSPRLHRYGAVAVVTGSNKAASLFDTMTGTNTAAPMDGMMGMM